MASRSKRGRFIQFTGRDKKRETIHLGDVTKAQAKAVKVKVLALTKSAILGLPIDGELVRWLGELSDEFYAKLVRVGLAPERMTLAAKRAMSVGDMVRETIASKAKLAKNSILSLQQAGDRLSEFLGASRRIETVTAGDADAYLAKLKKDDYAGASVSTYIKKAKAFFRFAHRLEIIPRNPFDGVRAPSQANDERHAFVSRPTIDAIMNACPDAQWRLIVALSRFGGLRCPSEILDLEWENVVWDRSRIRIGKHKTKFRWTPIFPELRPYLEDAQELAKPGDRHVITRYRNTEANLRTQLLRITARAGVTPWPRTFHNMRSTRQTELEQQFPLHVVCKWLGNSPSVAARHYLQVTEEHFEMASKSALQNALHTNQNERAFSRPDAPSLPENVNVF